MINIYNPVCTAATVQKTITINEWFDLIKYSDFSSLITQARNADEDKYNFIKKNRVPCCTYNFLYNKYKKDKNIISGTGYIYLDVDNVEFDPTTLDLNKVHAYYRSFGGEGLSIIVKVDGLTKENYRSTFTSIVTDLGIQKVIDINTRKASQYNVLSFDPNIYINNDSMTYSAVELNKQNSPHSIVKEKNPRTYTIEWGENSNSIRYDNVNEIDVPESYIVNWNGYEIIKAWIPIKKVQDGYRYQFFLGYATNLLWLNQFMTYEQLLGKLKSVNTFACLTPIAESQLVKITDSIVRARTEGTLQPIPFNKLRKIVFAKDCNLDKESKLAICRAELVNRKTDLSKQKIYDIIQDWNYNNLGKIGQAAIYNNFPVSSKTVEKYWSEFKGFVKDLNDQHIAEIRDFKQLKSKVDKDIAESDITPLMADMTVETLKEQALIEHPIFITEIDTIDDYEDLPDWSLNY